MPNVVALRALADKWAYAEASERANFAPYLIDLCKALGVEGPGPAGSGYQLELTIKVITKDGVEVANFIDCWRRDFFAIEAKDQEPGRSSDLLLRRAFGQVRNYVTYAPGGMPPYVMVMDVARTLIVWDRWNGNYGDWQAGRRIDLTKLHERPEDARLLHAIWTDPASLDSRAKAQAVTKEVAGYLANLARALEESGDDKDRVARFIMRCVFTMFAEDIGLLKDEPFRQVLERCSDDPAAFPEQATALWKAMDAGEKFDWKKLLRFNGHFFRDSEALPLSKQAILILRLAAEADWQDVEPAIFGTLLTRALDPAERHRLGAEFTPREFVERVVRPAVEEPIRERWKAEQAAVLQLREAGKKKDAEKRLRKFHDWMKALQFLDPACGSGNFLYVTMHLVKRIELEVLRELEEVTGKEQKELRLAEVGPWQFHGIEIKPWAREIAELVLWIGFHQFWKAHHDVQPPEPILQDTGTLECRDAVLAWDEIRHDPSRDRLDPTPRITHPVTGKLVPDPNAKLEYMEYVNPRQAEWPKADFVVGNPPYLGQSRQREELGDGYVKALRASYDYVPDNLDYVMYWWARSANLVATGQTSRAGLITTNTITQSQNREVIAAMAKRGAAVRWAVADHPWVDGPDGAAVRVALTVLSRPEGKAVLAEVDDRGVVFAEHHVAELNSDLSVNADVASAASVPLLSNEGLSATGFKLHGAGFLLEPEEAELVLSAESRLRFVVRRYRHGRDLTSRPRGLFVIDFATRSEDEARQFPVAFDIVRTRVKPERDANNDESRRVHWWRFGRTNETLRSALRGLGSYVATPETAKHRFFVVLDGDIAPDNMLICVCVDDGFTLGVLSSAAHVEWALASGGTLEDRPRYNKTLCFDPFPFPNPAPALRAQIAEVAEKLDAHRKAGIDREEVVTMTGMYNVVEKLKSGEALTPKERKVYEIAACGVLKDLHQELDALVAKAYGWEWPLEKDVILERLVALHDERVKEEEAGKVRWLRPDYQIPRFGKDLPAAEAALGLTDATPAAKKAKRPAWPADVISQIGAIKRLLADEALSADDVAARFTGAKADLVRRHLDILFVMGEVQQNPDGRYQGAA
jgi:hypothetical protein